MNLPKCIAIVAIVAVASLATAHNPTPIAHEPVVAVVKEPATVQAVVVAPAPVEVVTPEPIYPTGCENYLPLVKQYDWDVNIAMAIMQAENRSCDPTIDNAGMNRNGSVDYGLFQVNSVHADMVGGNLQKLRDPQVNVEVAYSLSRHGTNWTAWNTYKSGKYLSFLK